MGHHINGMARELGLAGLIYLCGLPLVWLIVSPTGNKYAFVGVVLGVVAYVKYG